MQPKPFSLGDVVSPILLLVISLLAGVALRFERLITLKCDVSAVNWNAAWHSVRSVHGYTFFALCLLLVDVPGALRHPSCLAVAGYVPGIRYSGLDGGGEASERDSSPITLVLGLEGLSRRLP